MTSLPLLAFDFLAPGWLSLLGLVVAVAVWLHRRTRAQLFRERLTLWMRMLVLTALVVALARPRVLDEVHQLAVVFVLDVSSSIPEVHRNGLLKRLEEQFTKIPPGDRAALVIFGERPSVEVPFTVALGREGDAGFGARLQNLESRLDRSESDLGSAVAFARSVMPPNTAQRIVLLSDGNETRGDLQDTARGLAASGTRLDVVPIDYAYEEEVLVEGVFAPGRTAANEPVEVRAVISSQVSTDAEVMLRVDDAVLATERVRLNPGTNVLRFTPERVSAGYREYEVVVKPVRDGNPSNNVGRASVIVGGDARALVVVPDGYEDRIVEALTSAGLAANAARPSSLPRHPAGYIGKSVIVLNNVPAYALDDSQRTALSDAVKELGVGLIVIGGDTSYSAGGYHGTPLADLLPVDLDTRNRRTMPKGALVIVLHSIEFDSGNTWAVRICKAALDGLQDSDDAAIVYYDGWKGEQWLFDLTPLSERKRLYALIDQVQVGDMVSFANCFDLAEASFEKSDAAVKHIVVISDGDPQLPSDATLARLVANKVTTSGVCIDPHGPGGPAPMAHMVQKGGGRFYRLSARTGLGSLPQLMLKESVTLRRSALLEKRFTPLVAAPNSPLLRGTETGFPSLDGYVVCGVRDGAETILLANEEEEDPLLAAWYSGTGRVIAFTSDATSRWAGDWLAWDRFGPFWAQLVRSAIRTTSDAAFPARIVSEGSSLMLLVEATDEFDAPVTNLTPTASLVGRDGKSERVRLRQERPGVYSARLEGLPQGHYLANVEYTHEGRTERSFAVGAVDFAPEHRALRSRPAVLEAAALATGGSVRKIDAPFFEHDFAAVQGQVEIWPALLIFAALLLCLEMVARRFDVDPSALLRRWRAARPAATPKTLTTATKATTAAGASPTYQPRPEAAKGDARATSNEQSDAKSKNSNTLAELKRERERKDKRREWK